MTSPDSPSPRTPMLCVCGHALSSHRQDPDDPWVAERCKTCGCACFDDGRPSGPVEEEAPSPRPEPLRATTTAGRFLEAGLRQLLGWDTDAAAHAITDIETEAAQQPPAPDGWWVPATAKGTAIGTDEWGRRLYVYDTTEPHPLADGVAAQQAPAPDGLRAAAHVFELVPRQKGDTSDMIFCPNCGATRWVRAAGEPLGPCPAPALLAAAPPSPAEPPRPWDHPYEAEADGVCVTCGLIGSYGHTEEYRNRAEARPPEGLDAAWANRENVAAHLCRAGVFRGPNAMKPAMAEAGRLILAAWTGERWDVDEDRLTPEQRALATRLSETTGEPRP